jgi:hypothetical protein
MPAQEGREWLDPSWLLDHTERSAVRRLSDHERADYERRFWLLMDPFWLTPANERWNEHIARHVEARLLADVPTVAGMVRWGADMDQLTIRYGTPTTRARQSASMMEQAGMIEYWDTAQRAFAPARLSRGVAAQPSPGERPLLYAASARSGYALQTVGRIVELDHQATRFLRGDSVVLRVDAAMPLVADTSSSLPSESMADAAGSTGEPAPAAGAAAGSGRAVARAGVFVYDSAFTRRTSSTGPAVADGDSVRFALFADAPAGALIYSAEILGDSLAAAGRARYAIHTPFAESGLALSDLLITRRFATCESADGMDDPRLRPFASLIFLPGDTVGIYAEVYRRGRAGVLDIQVALEDAGRPSLPGRLARWLGRTLGLVEPGEDPRVGWRGEATAARYVIALNVPLLEGRDGLYDLVVRVTDPATGEQTEARRRIRLN